MIKLHDFAARLAEKHSLSQEEVERFLSQMVHVMGEGLRSDKTLKIKGLGTFKVVPVNARESVDVNTGERIRIEGREKVSFTPETAMRDLVNKPFAQFETVVLNDGVDFEGENLEKNPSENLVEVPSENSPENPSEDSMEISSENEKTAEVESPAEETISQFVDTESSETTDEIVENERLEYQKPNIEVKMKKGKIEREPSDEVFDEGKYYDDELFDEYGYYIGPEDDERSWFARIFKNTKTIKWLMGILAAMVSLMFLGMFFMFYEIKRRDNQIEKFVEEINGTKHKGETALADRIKEVREAGAE